MSDHAREPDERERLVSRLTWRADWMEQAFKLKLRYWPIRTWSVHRDMLQEIVTDSREAARLLRDGAGGGEGDRA